MRQLKLRSGILLAAGAFAVAASVSGTPDAAAKDEPAGLVARYLETVEIAPAMEHRLVVVHPILAKTVPPVRGQEVRLGGTTSPDLLAFGEMPPASKSHTEAASFAEEPIVLLAGDVLRTETADLAVLRDTVVLKDKPIQVPLFRVSRDTVTDPAAVEPRMLGQVMPSALRYLLLQGGRAPDIRDASDRFAADMKLSTPRRSPAEYGLAESIATRVADYRKSLATLPQPAAGAEREVVGCAVFLDGALASIETFATGKLFTAVWPKLLEGIAAEAAVQELREDLLAEELAAPADPDRFLAEARKRLLAVFAARTTQSDVRDEGRQLELAVDGAVAHALVFGGDRIAHFVLITDPAHRGEERTTESPDLNVARRKSRPTEEEKRLLERRGNAGDPVPPAPPPAPPTPPAPPSPTPPAPPAPAPK